MSGRKPKDTWVGTKTEEPWKSLINSNRIKLIQDKLVGEPGSNSSNVPTSKPITLAESRRVNYSDFEEEDEVDGEINSDN